MLRKLAILGILFGSSLFALPANATTYTFSFTGFNFGTAVISGVVITDPSNLATSISGYVNAGTSGQESGFITSLVTPPNAYNTGGGWNADNIVVSTAPFLDIGGLLVNYGTQSAANIYWNGSNWYLSLGVAPHSGTGTIWNPGDPGVFTLTQAANGAAPLPAGLPLFASGMALVGLFGWYRKRRGGLALAA